MWEIQGDPRDESNFEKDAATYVWTLRRGEETQLVTVEITLPSIPGLAGEVAEARVTRGRSVIEGWLAEDQPHAHITVTTEGISF